MPSLAPQPPLKSHRLPSPYRWQDCSSLLLGTRDFELRNDSGRVSLRGMGLSASPVRLLPGHVLSRLPRSTRGNAFARANDMKGGNESLSPRDPPCFGEHIVTSSHGDTSSFRPRKYFIRGFPLDSRVRTLSIVECHCVYDTWSFCCKAFASPAIEGIT